MNYMTMLKTCSILNILILAPFLLTAGEADPLDDSELSWELLEAEAESADAPEENWMVMVNEMEIADASAPAPQQPASVAAPTDLPGHYQIERGYNITTSISALFWKAYEEGTDYVIKNKGTSGLDDDAKVSRATFAWDWGCRVDLGYQVPYKKMDLHAGWTYYETGHTVSNHADQPSALFSVWSTPDAQSSRAYEYKSKAYARLNLNMIDLGISATFSPRPFLDLTPFVDLSTLWLHQHFLFKLSGGPGLNGLTVVKDEINMRNNFWGIGPKLGLNTLWDIGYGFGICGNFNFSLLYGFFEVSQHEDTTYYNSAPIPYLDLDPHTFHLLRLNFDLFLGARWDKMLCNNRYHLFLEAGWETLLFLGQNQLMRFTTQSNSGINVSGKGDLGFEGLSMRASFTF